MQSSNINRVWRDVLLTEQCASGLHVSLEDVGLDLFS